MSFESIISDWLVDTESALIDNYNKLGLRASGSWAESLESFQEGGVSQGVRLGIKGKDYTEYIENGRRPNKDTDPKALKAWVGWAGSTFLKDWVRDKGIAANPYAVAWKIALKGWSVPNNYNAGGLVSDVLADGRMRDLNKQLSISIISEAKSKIINSLK